MRQPIAELAGGGISICGVVPKPLSGVRGKKTPGICPACGASLIASPWTRVCENPLCDSLPQNIVPAGSLEAWAGL